jgi:outer membrane protein
MKSILAASALALGLLAGGVAQAQTVGVQDAADANAPVGKKAGTLMVRLRAIGVIPQNTSSSVSLIGGKVDVTATPAPEVDLSYFFTDNIAVEGIAASTRHSVSATGTVIGKVPVGNVWVLPPTVTLQYHFMPTSRFSPYVGVGATMAFFYNSQAVGPVVKKFGLDNNIGAAIQVGFDYNFSGHWFANFDIKQVFLSTKARINGGAVIAKTNLDPTIIGAGIGYRF